MKNFLIFLLLITILSGCSTATTTVNKSIDIQQYKVAELQLPDDSWNLEASITKRIENLGFEVILPGSNKKPDLIIFADYQTYWDVVHQTFNYFDISFDDSATGDVLLSSSYKGRFGFNGCEAALDLVFRDLAAKLGDHENR